jgi:hypothetical protein
MGQRILDYFWFTHKMKDIFSDAFYDVLVGAEEIYEVPIIHGEPVPTKRNVLNISTFGGGDSYKVEDSEIIVDSGYVPIGKIIDDYWDVLTSDEIDKLESGFRENRFAGHLVFAGPIDSSMELADLGNSLLMVLPIMLLVVISIWKEMSM